MEQLDFNILFRWFVGLGLDDAVWDASTFCKNRDRLLEAEVSAKLLSGVINHKKVRRLLSRDHFSVAHRSFLHSRHHSGQSHALTQTVGAGATMTGPADCALIGKWRITEADLWNRDYFDMMDPAQITFENNGHGTLDVSMPALVANTQPRSSSLTGRVAMK